MSSLEERNLAVFKALKPAYTRKRIGYLGRYNADGTIDPDLHSGLSDEFVWVRFDGARGATRIKNLRVRAEWGVPVWVEFNELTREDEVREVHSIFAPQSYGGALAAALNVPAFPPNISNPVNATDLQALAVRPDANIGGLTVRILSGWAHGVWQDGSGIVTLTPTSTSAKTAFVCVGIDINNAVVQTLTADREPSSSFFTDGVLTSSGGADIQAVMDADPTTQWLWAFLLANGATSLDLSAQVDLRLFNQAVGGAANGSICLYHADGSAPQTFTADSGGLDDASAAAAAGDVIWIPPATIAGDHALSAGVEYAGAGRRTTLLTGQITGADGTIVRTLSISRVVSSSAAIIALLMSTGTLQVYQCTIRAENTGAGDAYAVMGADGQIDLHECVVSAEAASGNGYGTYATEGVIRMYGGVRAGSTADGQVGAISPSIPPGGDPATLAANGTNQAIFPNITSPQAYTYNGVTYVVWLGASFGTYIDAYTHATRTWAGAELVRSSPNVLMDDHSTPAVMVDDSGYIHVFFGGSSGAALPMYHSRSSNPEDISAWTNLSDIGADTTYHSAVKIADGTIYVFYTKRSGSRLYTYYVRSDESYGTEHLAHTSGSDGDSIYFGNPVYDETRGRIWFMWSYYEISLTKRRYLFLAYLDLSDHHWYGGMDDADMGTDTTTAEWVSHCQLLSSSYETNHPNLFLDGSGNLHILYNVIDSTVWKHAYRMWNGSSWGSIELITTANHQFNMGDLYVNADGTVEAYLVTNASAARGGSLEHWRRSAGGVWSSVRTIFDKASHATHDGVMFPQVNRTDTSGTVRLLFADDENTPTSNDLRVYALNQYDAYVITNPNAGIFLSGVQTVPANGMDTPMAGDRAAFDVTGYPALHADDLADATPKYHVPTPTAANKTVVSADDGAGGFMWQEDDAGTGAVTSVGLDAQPSGVFNVSGSPVTSTGTLSLSLDTQSANTFLGGPTSGSAAAPSFRTIAASHLTTRYEPVTNGDSGSPELIFHDGDVILWEVA